MVKFKFGTQRHTIGKIAKEIHKKTGISLRTVENNLRKLKECKSVERKKGSGRQTAQTLI